MYSIVDYYHTVITVDLSCDTINYTINLKTIFKYVITLSSVIMLCYVITSLIVRLFG